MIVYPTLAKDMIVYPNLAKDMIVYPTLAKDYDSVLYIYRVCLTLIGEALENPLLIHLRK